jgi:hypothetical protein
MLGGGKEIDATKSYGGKTVPRKKDLSRDIGFKWNIKDVSPSS